MLEHEVDVVALAGDLPDGGAELACLLHPRCIFRCVDRGHLAPAVELLAVDDAARAELHDEITLVVFGNHTDGIGAGRRAKLDRHGAEATRCAPNQHIMAGTQNVRAVAKQHAVGGGERQRIAGAFLPGQVLRPLHELAILHTGELRERAVRGFVAPDPLGRREHRVSAVAFLVVAVVLVAVDDDLVADLPALHLGADRPDDAGGVGPGDVIGLLVAVERRDRGAESRPDAVVVDARSHHQNQHVMTVERPGRHHLYLHCGIGLAMPFAADGPGVHVFGNVAERRDFADFIQVFGGDGRLGRG